MVIICNLVLIHTHTNRRESMSPVSRLIRTFHRSFIDPCVCVHVRKRGEEAQETTQDKSCRRHMGNGGDMGGKRKKRRQQRAGSVAANPDNLENNKETGGETQGTHGLSKNCTSRHVSPLSRLTRGFRNKYY